MQYVFEQFRYYYANSNMKRVKTLEHETGIIAFINCESI